MTIDHLTAQDVWDLCRAPIDPVDVLHATDSPAVLFALAERGTGRSGEADQRSLTYNPACPAPLIERLARTGSPRVKALAVLHRNCPPDVATNVLPDVFEQVELARRPLMFLPKPALQFIADQLPHVRTPHVLANRLAVANEGWVTGGTDGLVASWLRRRRLSELELIADPNRQTLVGSLAGRADLSEDEIVAYANAIARRGDAHQLVVFARQHPVEDGAALRLLAQLPLDAIESSWSRGLLLGRLIDGRDADMQAHAVDVACSAGWFDVDGVRALWETSRDADRVHRLARRVCDAGDDYWSERSLRVARTEELLEVRAQVPAPLRSLSGEQLAVFAALVSSWSGCLGQLIDVVVRTA